MLTREERAERRIHYINRFRNRSFENALEMDQTETKEYKQVDRRIKNLEAELQEARNEKYELNQAFDLVQREETVRKAKAVHGVDQAIDALLGEVYERTNQSTKLKGADYSYRHNLPNAYSAVRQFVVNGLFGNQYYDKKRDWHPQYLEYQLLANAMTIMWHDNTKKGQPLSDRVMAARDKAWKRWCDLGQPVDKGEAA